MTVTTNQPAKDEQPRIKSRTSRALVVVVIGLSVLAVGLGAWAIQATASGDVLNPPEDVAQLVEDWWEAAERKDGSLIEMYRPEGYHLYGTQVIELGDLPAHLGPGDHERITEPILVVDEGDGRYVVTRGVRNTLGGRSFASAVTYTIVTEPDGPLKFAYTEWTKVVH